MRTITVHKHSHWIDRVLLVILSAALLTSCAVSGGYWIPPSAPPTQTVFLPPASIGSGSQSPEDTPAPADPVALEPSFTPAELLAEPASPTPVQELLPTQAAPAVPAVSPETTAPPVQFLPTLTPTPEIYAVDSGPILYYTQAGDTLRVVAIRFGVRQDEITSTDAIPSEGFIDPDHLLIIPRRLANTTASDQLIPDSEVVYSPSAATFDSLEFANAAGGFLAGFKEWHRSTGNKTGAEIVERVAIENSINPRLLLALLEYHSGWVYGQPATAEQKEYPLGRVDLKEKNLYNQLIWTVNQLSIGYYAYREGRLTEIKFSDGNKIRLAPDLNAGTAALQYYFAQLYDIQGWLSVLDKENGFPALYNHMFGDPWQRARTVEPLFPSGIKQPPLTLPFARDWTWSYTGGPHGAWEHDGAYAALDFAPGAEESGCVETPAWAVASADGLVVRTGPGLVVIDLDGDGHEQTGWVLVYLHLAEKGRISLGSWAAAGDPIGHPSCEGGMSTGTHLHIARKFNGEWVPADGALPFNLGGWVARAGALPYEGTLTRDGKTLEACTCSNNKTFIIRLDTDP